MLDGSGSTVAQWSGAPFDIRRYSVQDLLVIKHTV